MQRRSLAVSHADLHEQPHYRLNILTGEEVLVSPHRAKRPWQGKVESVHQSVRPAYDPLCYLCKGNLRADGERNPDYADTFVFSNDFAALLEDSLSLHQNEKNLLVSKSENGICRVIVFSPDHGLTLAEMTLPAITGVVNTWATENETLAQHSWIRYIQIFENKGEIMGCSNPHPHGQIWAQSSLPPEIKKELMQQQIYFAKHKKSLLGDYLELELNKKERIILENDYFVALVPFWAVWPYETLVISKRHVQQIQQFDTAEREALADTIRRLTIRYDNLFKTSFPYSAGIHQAPVNDGQHPEWHWHMHFYPPLLRSATVKKFMVGYEMLAGPQRDITPEYAAMRLREVSELHYKLEKT